MSSETSLPSSPTISEGILNADISQPAGFRQRIAGRGLQYALRQAGPALSKREARVISRQTGRSIAEVMGSALSKGVGLNSGLVNKFNKGKLGSSLQSLGFFGQVPPALRALEPLRGLSLPQKSVYLGSSVREVPSEGYGKYLSAPSNRTEYTPVVVPRALLNTALLSGSSPNGYSLPAQSGTGAEDVGTAVLSRQNKAKTFMETTLSGINKNRRSFGRS